MEELKRTDRPRYDRILRAALKETRRLKGTPARNCEHCGLRLPDDVRTDAKYCDTTCQRAARLARSEAKTLPIAA